MSEWAEMLGSARSADSSATNMVLVLTCLGVVAASAVLALIPWRMARGRRDALLTAIVVWVLVLDASAIMTAIDRAKWAEESALRLQTGFYDPATAEVGAPTWPWRTWGVLAVAYGGLVAWGAAGSGRRRVGFDGGDSVR